MKLVAHSLIPANPLPYLHPGYTFAMTATPTTDGYLAAGFFTMSLAGALLAARWYRRPALAWLSIVLLLCGIGGLTMTWQRPGIRKHIDSRLE